MPAEQLRRIHQMVGELSSKVSEIELGWYLMFTGLMHQTPRHITDAIINVQRTGEGQRQIVMGVANAIFPDPASDVIVFLGQIKGRTDDLMGRRNDAVHGIIYVATFIIPPRVSVSGASKRSRMADKHIEAELKGCLAEADKLLQAIKVFLDSMNVSGRPTPDLEPLQLGAGWINPLLGMPQEGSPLFHVGSLRSSFPAIR